MERTSERTVGCFPVRTAAGARLLGCGRFVRLESVASSANSVCSTAHIKGLRPLCSIDSKHHSISAPARLVHLSDVAEAELEAAEAEAEAAAVHAVVEGLKSNTEAYMQVG